MFALRYQLQVFLLTIGFLTRIPVPPDPDFSQSKLDRCPRYFPLVGLCIGALVAGLTVILAQLLPVGLAVLVGMAASLRLTGAFHEDGLADSVDGLGGGMNPSRAIEIMKDSRLGTYGSCALFFSFSIKYGCLTALFFQDISHGALALLLVHGLSRLAPLWLMGALPYAGDQDKQKSKPLAKSLRVDDLLVAHIFGLGPLLLLGIPKAFALVAVALLITSSWGRALKRKINGYTGDTLGAAQQFVELGCYLFLVTQ